MRQSGLMVLCQLTYSVHYLLFTPMQGSELNLMINPFPAGGMFTGEGVVNYAMAGGVAVYERPTRPIAIPAEYNSVRCRTMVSTHQTGVWM